jgi:epoxyqueuosine reductase
VSLLTDASPLVRGAAIWALSQLLEPDAFARLVPAHADPDAGVADEWQAGRSPARVGERRADDAHGEYAS